MLEEQMKRKALAIPLCRDGELTMQLEDYFDFQRPDDIRLKGTRIGIETILYDFIHRSRTPE
jgi:hypothetical protein